MEEGTQHYVSLELIIRIYLCQHCFSCSGYIDYMYEIPVIYCCHKDLISFLLLFERYILLYVLGLHRVETPHLLNEQGFLLP